MKREIETKYLLKDYQARQQLLDDLQTVYPAMAHKGTKRIISYFYEAGATNEQVLNAARTLLGGSNLAELKQLLCNSAALMVKCRSIDETKYFSVKGSLADADPVHAVNRLEFEAVVDMDLETIDQHLKTAGITIVSKWSSTRDVYELDKTMKADIEFVSGYGYKAELEIVINDGEPAEVAINSITSLANKLGLEEASGELFARAYAYYNQHWREYFDTDRVFDEAIWKQLGR